jgi:hypothetical protein
MESIEKLTICKMSRVLSRIVTLFTDPKSYQWPGLGTGINFLGLCLLK